MAEEVGFEPTDACASTVFKTAAFGRSATPPYSFCTMYYEPRFVSTDFFNAAHIGA